MSSPKRIQIDARRLARRVLLACLVFEAFLLVADASLHHGAWVPRPMRELFNLAIENALGSWFAVTQTIFAALTAWALVGLSRTAGEERRAVTGWTLLAILLTLMAIDDGAVVHERVGTAARQLFAGPAADLSADPGLLGGFPSYGWLVVFVPLYAAAVVVLGGFLWSEIDARPGRRALTAVLLLLVVAVVLDFFEGLAPGHPWNWRPALAATLGMGEAGSPASGDGGVALVVHGSRMLEELLEMVALTLLWVTLLQAAMLRARTLTVSFEDPSSVP